MLNPSMYSATQPAQVRGEHFLLCRPGIHCEVKVDGLPKLKGIGNLVLTTLRIVFVCNKSVPLGEGMSFDAFDLPLTTLSEEKFEQPIFGANYLRGKVQPIENGGLPGPASFRLTFREGGCGTFLYFFLRALREVRGGSLTLGSIAASGTLQTESAAFVDPNDPTTIYVVQPSKAPEAQTDPASYGPRGAPFNGLSTRAL